MNGPLFDLRGAPRLAPVAGARSPAVALLAVGVGPMRALEED